MKNATLRSEFAIFRRQGCAVVKVYYRIFSLHFFEIFVHFVRKETLAGVFLKKVTLSNELFSRRPKVKSHVVVCVRVRAFERVSVRGFVSCFVLLFVCSCVLACVGVSVCEVLLSLVKVSEFVFVTNNTSHLYVSLFFGVFCGLMVRSFSGGVLSFFGSVFFISPHVVVLLLQLPSCICRTCSFLFWEHPRSVGRHSLCEQVDKILGTFCFSGYWQHCTAWRAHSDPYLVIMAILVLLQIALEDLLVEGRLSGTLFKLL